jgi:hypothetical protein
MMVKKNSVIDLITYISLALMIVLVIVFLKYKFSLRKENFSEPDKIIIKDSFYDLTSSEFSPLFSDTPSDNKVNDKIGGSNLCIYKTDTANNKIIDIECISSGEMQNALSLPEFRKTNVCIDEECINLDDVYILTGKKPFKLVNNSDYRPNVTNKSALDCVYYKNNPGYLGKTCKSKEIRSGADRGIPTLANTKCYNNINTNFIITPGTFTKGMARDADPTVGMHAHDTGGAGGDIRVAPVHD